MLQDQKRPFIQELLLYPYDAEEHPEQPPEQCETSIIPSLSLPISVALLAPPTLVIVIISYVYIPSQGIPSCPRQHGHSSHRKYTAVVAVFSPPHQTPGALREYQSSYMKRRMVIYSTKSPPTNPEGATQKIHQISRLNIPPRGTYLTAIF